MNGKVVQDTPEVTEIPTTEVPTVDQVKLQEAAKKVAEKEAAKAAKAAEKAVKAAEKEAAKAAMKVEKIESKTPLQNGIRQPRPGGLCAQAWDIFDAISAKNQSPASSAESIALAKTANLNLSNVRAEYARWRKFHGLTGRIQAPADISPATPVAA